MVKPYEKSLKHKFRKTPGRVTKKVFFKEKSQKKKCPVCEIELAGVASGRKAKLGKLSKSEKRPSAPFGGVLSGKGREQVFVEAAKVHTGVKTIEDVEEKYKAFVKQALEMMKK